jgi:hypothetical protein
VGCSGLAFRSWGESGVASLLLTIATKELCKPLPSCGFQAVNNFWIPQSSWGMTSKVVGLFKNVQMQGAQKTNREAYMDIR